MKYLLNKIIKLTIIIVDNTHKVLFKWGENVTVELINLIIFIFLSKFYLILFYFFCNRSILNSNEIILLVKCMELCYLSLLILEKILYFIFYSDLKI